MSEMLTKYYTKYIYSNFTIRKIYKSLENAIDGLNQTLTVKVESFIHFN